MLKPDFEPPTPPPPPLPEQEPFSPSALTASLPPPPSSSSSSSLLDDVLSAFHSPNAAGFSTTDDNAMKTTMTAPRGWNDDADDAASSSPMDADFRFENRGGAASAMGINVHDDVNAESRGKKKFFL